MRARVSPVFARTRALTHTARTAKTSCWGEFSRRLVVGATRALTDTARTASQSAVVGLVTLLMAVATTSCDRGTAAIPEAPTDLLSVVEMANPVGLPQLVHGFWKLEDGSWRWVAKRFRVVLQAPASASTRGATVELHFTLPKQVLAGVETVRLAATVNGMTLPYVAFATEGAQTFWRVVPPEAFAVQPVTVEITVSRALPPIPGDERELALVVSKIGLLAR